jgi:hypothetical protein
VLISCLLLYKKRGNSRWIIWITKS